MTTCMPAFSAVEIRAGWWAGRLKSVVHLMVRLSAVGVKVPDESRSLTDRASPLDYLYMTCELSNIWPPSCR